MPDAPLTDSAALATPGDAGTIVVPGSFDLARLPPNYQGPVTFAPCATINNNAGATINQGETIHINNGTACGGGEPLTTKADIRELQAQMTQLPQQLAAAVIEKIGDKIKQIVTEIFDQLRLNN